jgi:flagellar biosynthesis anti-sigma factor FlgM
MKVNNNKDSVELSQIARSKKGDKAAAAKAKGDAAAAAPTLAAGETANVEISSEAKAMANAKQIAKSGEATDQAKIDRIKAMIGSGTYKPDYGKVADKVVNETLLQELS